jgi:hypothetical protein
LHPEQEWCLSCGAAARTRLAAAPDWKAPMAVIAVVIALSLGVLAAALVKLAGDTGSTVAPSTTTVTTPPAAVAPTPTTALPGATTSTPSTTVPGTSAPGASGATTSPALTGTTAAPTTTSPTTTPQRGKGLGLSPRVEKLLRERGLLPGTKGK